MALLAGDPLSIWGLRLRPLASGLTSDHSSVRYGSPVTLGRAVAAVTASESAKSFGRYKEEAQRQPIAITSYGRVSGYFVSAQEFQELRRLRAFERRVLRIKDLPAGIVEAIKASKMDPAHEHLNALLDDSAK